MTDATSIHEQLFDVRDSRVVVTGAASGLGFAMAEVLADCGARVTLADVDAERLERMTAQLAERGCAVRSFVVDVSDEDRVKALIDDVVAAEGGLDVVIANAGIAAVPGFAVEGGQQLSTVERQDWDKVLGVNLNGVLFTMKHAAAAMKRQGSGRIIVMSSNAGIRAGAGGLLRVRREQGRGHQHGATGGSGARAARHPRERHLPGPFKGTRIGGGVTEDPDAGARGDVGADRSSRPDGRSGGAQGAHAAARVAGIELHDRAPPISSTAARSSSPRASDRVGSWRS